MATRAVDDTETTPFLTGSGTGPGATATAPATSAPAVSSPAADASSGGILDAATAPPVPDTSYITNAPAPAPTPTLAQQPSPGQGTNYTGLAGAAPSPAPAPQATAAQGTFDESKGVAGRVASLTATDSPIMQQARLAANEDAARRGLTGSTLGVQAGEQAAIASAVPIATADAQLYQQQALQNQQFQQQVNLANPALNQQQQQINAQREQFAQSLGVSVADLQTRRDSLTQQQQQFLDNLDLQTKQLQQQDQQFRINQQTQIVLGNMDLQSKASLQNAANANQFAISNDSNIANAWGSMLQQIGQIQNNPQLGNEAKTTLVQNTIASFGAYAKFWQGISGLPGVTQLLNFGVATPSGAPGATDNGTASGQPSVIPGPGGGVGAGGGNGGGE